MKIKAEILPSIKKIRFYNQLTREEETFEPVFRVGLNGEGKLSFYTLDNAWRGVSPADIYEINGQDAAQFMTI